MKKSTRNWIVFAVVAACVVACGLLEDGPQEAQRSQDAYCARVAAGAHTDYDNLCTTKRSDQ